MTNQVTTTTTLTEAQKFVKDGTRHDAMVSLSGVVTTA